MAANDPDLQLAGVTVAAAGMVTPLTSQHRRFTLLTLLLRLVLVVYGGNAELVAKPLIQNREDDELEDDMWFEPLDALAAILVQRDEIIATTYLSKCFTVILSEDSKTPGTDLELPVSSTQPNPENNKLSIYPLNIVAIANPDTKGQAKFPKKSHTPDAKRQAGPNTNSPDNSQGKNPTQANHHDLRAVTDGENLWPRVLVDPLCFAFEGPRSLPDHAMTLASYLNAYRKAEKDEQASYSRAFFQYILTTCWDKMYRRITTWTAVGFIFRLNDLVDGFQHRIKESWCEVTEPVLGPGDHSLRQLLRNFDQAGIVQTIMRCPLPPEKLMSAINGSGPIYTKETAFEFHNLVCSAFINYASALASIKRDHNTWQKKKSDEDATNLKNTFVTLDIFTRLLLSILSSSSFKSHIKFLMSAFTLSSLLPPDKFMDQYKTFAVRYHLDLDEAAKGGTLEPEGSGEHDTDSDAEKVESYETLAGLLSWLRNFVIHFLGKRALERHCVKVKDEQLAFVRFRILAVGRSAHGVQSPEWSEFKTIIDELMDDKSSANSVISQLLDFIRKGSPNRSEKGRTIATFQKILTLNAESCRGIQWPGPHCEAIAAALHNNIDCAYPHGDDILLSVCQVMEHDVIGVSKLCCPACWELMQVLKVLYDQRFMVRGFHTTVYPVQLPSWLPQTVVDQMVTRFESHLRDTLSLLLKSKSMEMTHKTHRTRESQSNISVASTTTDEPAQDGPYETVTKFGQAYEQFLARQEALS